MSEAVKMNAKERRKLRRAAEVASEDPQSKNAQVEIGNSDTTSMPVKQASDGAKEQVKIETIKDKPDSTKVGEDFIQLPSVSADKDSTKEGRLAKRAAKQANPPAKESESHSSTDTNSKEQPAENTLTQSKDTENTEPSEMNAKARRLAKRAAKQEPPTTNETINPESNLTNNAKARRLEKRAAQREQGSTEPSKKTPKRKLKDPNAKSIHLTLFLGQLPFDATEEIIRKHFHEAGEIKIRMLTDKKTKKFKGTAFIEVADSKALGAALARHHSLINGRRINVELTANGGGNKSELRVSRITELREKQKVKQVEKVQALLQKHVDDPECKLIQEDVDERMTDFLSWFDYDTAKLALDDFNRCVGDRVLNRRAFFMGILKRFRTTDGVEEERPQKRNFKSGGHTDRPRGDFKSGGRPDRPRGDFKSGGRPDRPSGNFNKRDGSRPPSKRPRHGE